MSRMEQPLDWSTFPFPEHNRKNKKNNDMSCS
jgi:hypothetical protein